MKNTSKKPRSFKILLLLVIIMAVFVAYSGQILQAIPIATVPKITINPTLILLPSVDVSIGTIGETSAVVIGSTNVESPDSRYIRIRRKGNAWSLSIIISPLFKFSHKYSSLEAGVTYEAQAYIKENSVNYYSEIVEFVPRDDPEFIVTTTPDHDLVDEDLLIGFDLDIDPNGHTLSDVSIAISGPGLSSSSSGLTVPVTQKYTNIQGNAVYTVTFECVTNFDTFTHEVVYNTTLTATPTPTPEPTSAPAETTAAPETTAAMTAETTAETSEAVTESETDMDMTTESGDATGTLVEGNDDQDKGTGFFSSDNLTVLIVVGVVILLLIAVIIILLILRSKPKPPTEPPMEG